MCSVPSCSPGGFDTNFRYFLKESVLRGGAGLGDLGVLSFREGDMGGVCMTTADMGGVSMTTSDMGGVSMTTADIGGGGSITTADI